VRWVGNDLQQLDRSRAGDSVDILGANDNELFLDGQRRERWHNGCGHEADTRGNGARELPARR
jgi:hypothetical protein